MSQRRQTLIEVGREFNITIPGPVPKQPEFNDHIQCSCDHCTAYLGTYQVDPADQDEFGIDLVQ